jgi:hypothetical protein
MSNVLFNTELKFFLYLVHNMLAGAKWTIYEDESAFLIKIKKKPIYFETLFFSLDSLSNLE